MTKKHFLLMVVASITLILLICIAAIYTFKSLHQARSYKDHTLEISTFTSNVLARLADAETGERGYVITGDEAYLEPYNSAIEFFNDPHTQYFFEHQKIPTLSQDYLLLESQIQNLLKQLQVVVDIRKNQGFEAAKKEISAGKGKGIMDQIRTGLDKILTHQHEHFEASDKQIESNIETLLVIILCGNALALSLVGGCFYFVYRELQKIRSIERELSELNEWQSAILNSTTQAVITLDFNGNILSYNVGAENLLGYKNSEMLHKSILKIFDGTSNTATLQQLSRQYGTKLYNPLDVIQYLQREGFASQNTIWQVRRKDQSIFDLSLTFTPLTDAQGNVKGALLTGTDVTLRQKWEKASLPSPQKSPL